MLRVPATKMRHKAILHGPQVSTPAGLVDGPSRTVRANVITRTRIVKSSGAEQQTSGAQVELDPENAPEVGSYITAGIGTPYERKGRVLKVDVFEKPRQATYLTAFIE